MSVPSGVLTSGALQGGDIGHRTSAVVCNGHHASSPCYPIRCNPWHEPRNFRKTLLPLRAPLPQGMVRRRAIRPRRPRHRSRLPQWRPGSIAVESAFDLAVPHMPNKGACRSTHRTGRHTDTAFHVLPLGRGTCSKNRFDTSGIGMRPHRGANRRLDTSQPLRVAEFRASVSLRSQTRDSPTRLHRS
jgi:hypothetical protein